VSVGTGVSNVTVTNTNVVVTPASGFSGKTTVVVSTLDGGVQTTVKIPVIVNPLEPITPVVTPVAPTLSTITWKTDPSAIRYQVNIDGKLACISTTNSCNVLQLVGPAADVKVQAKGNSQTESAVVDAAYIAKKPVTALVVHFENNSAVLNPVDKIEIKALAITIAAQGFKNVVITGHTDKNTGVDNQALSKARAEATLAYLKKVAPKINATIGAFASTKPAIAGSSADALAANRRAEIGVY
jgi:outer membrane protein OmpA-like peptidoglycan-associated protein